MEVRKPRLANQKECTGCMACVDGCRQDALKTFIGEDGHYYVKLVEDQCIGCLICEKTCPIVSKLDYSKSPLSLAYAGWAKDDTIRKSSATAGAFAAMALKILSDGGYVCGAAFIDGKNVKHICINKSENLHLLQGSKYTQSDASGIYETVFLYLKEGAIVLFSGTGCQVAGLYGYLRKKTYGGKLYTIDLICGGVPSRLLIDTFIEHEPYTFKRIISFRNKDKGWSPRGFMYSLKVEDSQGIVHDYTGKRNLITTGFACEITNRYSCYQCKFAGIHRMSDFTIGDYWGVKDFPEQHLNGVSVIIAHNERAVEFMRSCATFLETQDADLNNILTHNKRLRKTKDKRYLLPERMLIDKAFKNLNYKTLCKIYSLDFDDKSPWMLYKAYRAIVSRLLNRE